MRVAIFSKSVMICDFAGTGMSTGSGSFLPFFRERG